MALAGCAALDPRPSHEIVKERAQARWDAMVRGDLKAAYGYMSPAGRSISTLEGWTGSLRPGSWKSVVVEKAVCEAPETCDAFLHVEMEYKGGRYKVPVKETWIKDSGIWWFVQK